MHAFLHPNTYISLKNINKKYSRKQKFKTFLKNNIKLLLISLLFHDIKLFSFFLLKLLRIEKNKEIVLSFLKNIFNEISTYSSVQHNIDTVLIILKGRFREKGKNIRKGTKKFVFGKKLTYSLKNFNYQYLLTDGATKAGSFGIRVYFFYSNNKFY
jgi:hypothetical protein